MTFMIVLSNTVLAGLVLLFGALYPTVSIWSHSAVGLIFFHLFFQLMVNKARIFDAAKISVLTIQFLSAIISMSLLLLFTLRLGDIWALLAAAVVGCMMLVTVTALITLKDPKLFDGPPIE